MKYSPYAFLLLFFVVCSALKTPIDREALVNRNNPHVNSFDSLSPFTVGNGEFAFTVDITGLQTFPTKYSHGIALGTQSQWAWHSFPNVNNYLFAETLKNYNFRGKEEAYSTQFNEAGRQNDAANWFRINPHRLHLGIVGFDLNTESFTQINSIDQKLDMWTGQIISRFVLNGKTVTTQTACHPSIDAIASHINSQARIPIKFKFPYPSGGHVDDACDWNSNSKHSTVIVKQSKHAVLLQRIIDKYIYYLLSL